MPVTANFLQDSIEVLPGSPTTLTLRLHNDGDISRVARLEPSGDLAGYLKLDAVATTMETNQIVDVPVTLEVPATFEPGPRSVGVQVTSHAGTASPGTATPAAEDDTDTVMATATADIAAHNDYTVELRPLRSRSASAGRHRVRVVNTGNVVVTVDLSPTHDDEPISIVMPAPSLSVAPGTTGEAQLRVTPATTYWSGQNRIYDFVVRAAVSDGTTEELPGNFEQHPRFPNWLGPAAAGALMALLIGAIVWFAFLRPWVEDTADDAAADALALGIEELQDLAAEAEELPLGTPTDFQLSVAPTAGNTESASDRVRPGMTLSVSDLVFQNPTGAVGTVTLRRDDDVLLQSELANFRDFDLHLVAPYTFEAPSQVILEVECRTPGAGASDCPVNLSVLGFLDESG